MCKGTTHTTLRCSDNLNLKIQYLEKEIEVQRRVIKQWKALFESSQNKPVRECHVNYTIDHSKYNYVAKSTQSRNFPQLDAQSSTDVRNENWYMIKAIALQVGSVH